MALLQLRTLWPDADLAHAPTAARQENSEKNCGAAERVTNDDKYNDWFPHFSPDGKWIVIISYGLDIQPSDHPYYKHCYLRIMPTDGSAPPKVIAYVYGGQGTINVPSWSPDGAHVAFVSNSDVL